MQKRKNMYVPSKMHYVRGERPPVDCIFCGIIEKNKSVVDLTIHESHTFIISANLYPYNPGHLIIFPKKHREHYEDLSIENVLELHQLTVASLQVLKKVYTPQGFNMGFNEGRVAGASIEHLHFHVVPRYANEIGFLDIINNDRVIVEDPRETVKKLKEAFLQKHKHGKQS